MAALAMISGDSAGVATAGPVVACPGGYFAPSLSECPPVPVHHVPNPRDRPGGQGGGGNGGLLGGLLGGLGL